MMTRREILAAGAATLPALAAAAPVSADDESYWRGIAAHYDVTREVIQLENGNWSMMARPVLATYQDLLTRVNRDTSYYARRGLMQDEIAVRDRLAAFAGVEPDEIAFTRNATEALKALILGYNRLERGDAILYADLDYDSMQACMDSLATQRGARVARIALPEPATRQALLDAYAEAFAANPKLRMILLTQVSHRTGLALPVREIVAIARARGIDTIVDAAHGWCQLESSVADLGADFVGLNGHKWLGAPLGVGFVYIRRGRLGAIDPDPANEAGATGIAARVHTGTVDYAAQLSVAAAIGFGESIGTARRAARLRALRDRWVAKARLVPGLEILTPDDPALHGAITSFRVKGLTGADENAALAKTLLTRHRIFTVHRTGVAAGACIRVTPGLCNSMADVDALATALPALVAARS